MIVGIDEVGRGPWAGPLVFGAVVLGGEVIEGLTDSKKLTKKKREALEPTIKEKALGYGLGWVSAEELDEVGMSKACELGCRRSLEQVTVPYTQIILDGIVNFLKDTGKGPYVTLMKQADLLIPSVSAASVLAKVARDRYMEQQDAVFPGYGFASHVGYGTAAHQKALEALGVTTLHRKSFAPIAAIVNGTKNITSDMAVVLVDEASGVVTTRQIGDTSEDAVATFLTGSGYDIVERNWKTKLCEIDIIAAKNSILYFVEVKHRKTNTQGDGFDAITKKKLDQMRFAARVYLHAKKSDWTDARLAVASTTGEDDVEIRYLELE